MDAWLTLAVVALVLALLIVTRRAPDVILMGGLTLLLIVPVPTDAGWRVGVIDPRDALAGLANPGLVTVAVLFIVVAGLRETGGIAWIAHRLLGRPNSLWSAQVRITAPVLGLSAFLNNTPVVAMMIPAVADWARRIQQSPSRLLMPLSYAAILGGTCTLIGTSTNLVVNGLIIERFGQDASLGMFDIAAVGLPCAAAGLAYILTLGRRFLPDRKPAFQPNDDPRRYTVEMIVQPGSPLVGKTIEQAGLRHLPGVYLAEIDRGGQVIPAVSPQTTLDANDRLVFVGVVESVNDLRKIRGLEPATDQLFKLDAPQHDRCLIEAVVSNSNPLLGRTIREGRFRSVYDAAVIAVARGGKRLHGKIGDIALQPGDTLLLETHPGFIDRHKNRRDFFLVTGVENSTPPRFEKAGLAILILLAMVALVAAGAMPMMTAALAAAAAMVLTRCCTPAAARRAVDWSLLVVIAAAFGIGAAMQETGAAQMVAAAVLALAGDHPLLTLVAVYLLTALFTELITNNAAAVLMFPIAVDAANELGDAGVNPMPFLIAIMIAASASFITPIGYQTNLMVMGPGGYRFADYLKAGLPLALIVFALTILLAPRIWPF
jgi:di/tricarboxylate transporter